MNDIIDWNSDGGVCTKTKQGEEIAYVIGLSGETVVIWRSAGV